MPLQATSGAASYDAFGGGVPVVPNYIEEVFSTWLYTGTGASQTITNGIDLSTKGGMVWVKSRSNTYNNAVIDTVRGMTYSNYRALFTNLTDAQTSSFSNIMQANTDGFSYGTSGTGTAINSNGATYASWTFRKQPKFFDVVTYTGTGSNTTIAHNLGSTVGSIIIKRTDTTSNWAVWHVELGNGEYLQLNTTDAKTLDSTVFQSTNPTSTIFRVGTSSLTNASGGTYVAYIFAHDAGGFGLTGTDNVISCGSFTTDGSGVATVNLGYEPQWLLIKRSDSTQNWYVIDNMRGLYTGDDIASPVLVPNLSNAESSINVFASATGFRTNPLLSSATYIYIAIRRGPMKVPTDGTSVFEPVARAGTSAATTVTTNFPVDSFWSKTRDAAFTTAVFTRLIGQKHLSTSATVAETDYSGLVAFDSNTGFKITSSLALTLVNNSAYNYIQYGFKRAPSVFDVVCYSGDGTDNRAIAHNLTVAPEFIIVKRRDGTGNWSCYCQYITGGASSRVYLQTTAASVTSINDWAATNPTATNFYISSTSTAVNNSGNTYVSYLFATCAGVSKVGSYTGTATTKQIDCGFTGGARFVLIKRTDSTGDWYVWDTARGIVSGNDPYFLLNTTTNEVTNTDYIDTYSAGFELSSTAPAAINASGGTYIFLAIA